MLSTHANFKLTHYPDFAQERPQCVARRASLGEPPRPGSRASRWAAGRRTDLCGAMSAYRLISSACTPASDILGKAGKV